ncbi:MAG TPA: aminopeptidase P family protein [Bacteroidales bacterium]|nr:aminopeptidase P family protein [Bacteroidales bacterium]HOM39457.1 aminopeptidase P family protein [Bacteroidales bacterium]HPP93064.1 aminopeptidase P family protein [Bacteroidales bacterium]HRR16243.1 aminopeptidase P family protein [Bacteroidales bacterium]HRT47606.1 aminopeptidase P family protein [Bacteroidales bacterium]
MFSSEVYSDRRQKLRSLVKSGLAFFPGNVESPVNYPANPYHFRQDSSFLYFFGLDLPGLAGVIDFDSGDEWIFGDDFDLNDIVWMGPQPTVRELAMKCGIVKTAPLKKLEEIIADAVSKKRKIHFLPPYRGETKMMLGSLLKEDPCKMKTLASEELIRAVVSLRIIKEAIEIEEIEKAVNISWEMHVTAMKMCRAGVKEQEIFGVIEGIAWSKGAGPAFPVILSINGQTLHNHAHNNILTEGRMMVTDAGAESLLHYASDITRTTPVGGKFNSRQRDIYEVVLRANNLAIGEAKPGKSFRQIHIDACKAIAQGMKELGLMKGDTEEAVMQGAHALFMPHGLGHMLGLDVHDMEGLGENYVGYNDRTKRSDQFGLSFLRFALECKPGHVITIEPGCYFIPQLIDQWKSEGKFKEYICYDRLESYRDFGGIRIEDNIAITETGCRLLGRPIPKTVEEIESVCS